MTLLWSLVIGSFTALFFFVKPFLLTCFDYNLSYFLCALHSICNWICGKRISNGSTHAKSHNNMKHIIIFSVNHQVLNIRLHLSFVQTYKVLFFSFFQSVFSSLTHQVWKECFWTIYIAPVGVVFSCQAWICFLIYCPIFSSTSPNLFCTDHANK